MSVPLLAVCSPVVYLTPFSYLSHNGSYILSQKQNLESCHAQKMGVGGWHNGNLPEVTHKLNFSKKEVGEGRCPRQREQRG